MQKESSWNGIGKTLCKIVFNIAYNGSFLWLAVNFFFLAFNIPWHLTFAQSISICFLYFSVCGIFGIGGSSK
jgi:hypothetical protein